MDGQLNYFINIEFTEIGNYTAIMWKTIPALRERTLKYLRVKNLDEYNLSWKVSGEKKKVRVYRHIKQMTKQIKLKVNKRWIWVEGIWLLLYYQSDSVSAGSASVGSTKLIYKWAGCNPPFYTRDLSIRRFWCPLGVLEAIPGGYWRMTVFLFFNFLEVWNYFQIKCLLYFKGTTTY